MDAAVVLHPDVTVTQTEVETTQEAALESPPVLRLRLKKPKNDRKVEWREDTVDNEHMGKKKSKCCCIYKKPTKFGESSSEDDEECEHCFGHPEKRRKNRKKHPNIGDNDDDEDQHSDDDSDAAGPSGSYKPRVESSDKVTAVRD